MCADFPTVPRRYVVYHASAGLANRMQVIATLSMLASEQFFDTNAVLHLVAVLDIYLCSAE